MGYLLDLVFLLSGVVRPSLVVCVKLITWEFATRGGIMSRTGAYDDGGGAPLTFAQKLRAVLSVLVVPLPVVQLIVGRAVDFFYARCRH